MSVAIKSIGGIDLMREVGRILAITREELAKAVRPGISTMDTDRLEEETIRGYGCIPSFKSYNDHLASIYVSVNDEVVRGIPSKRRISQEGDIVSLDAGVIYKGFHSDVTRTRAVGGVSQEVEELTEIARQGLFEGIKYAKPGNHLNDISFAIAAYAEKFGYGMIRDLVGHGIDSHFHEDPEVPNFPWRGGGIKLQASMALAIEPIVNTGRSDVEWLDDDWTVVIEDGSLSAYYENTILICGNGPEILSMLSSDGKSPSPAPGEKG